MEDKKFNNADQRPHLVVVQKPSSTSGTKDNYLSSRKELERKKRNRFNLGWIKEEKQAGRLVGESLGGINVEKARPMAHLKRYCRQSRLNALG
ncbi:hypothetical protein KQX54_018306 [Cotesia glomerata]|uniref:Uncharacterized protein n=1 Tax=Cotesia glomerata TaxID=32391 RepID=A0AAV7J8L3_COTGL|nr:hypothetical protein KQX54_018306 [Cotesia glomerata]